MTNSAYEATNSDVEKLIASIKPDLVMLCDSEELTAERRTALSRIVGQLTPPNLLALIAALEQAKLQNKLHERAEFTFMNALNLPDTAGRNEILAGILAVNYSLSAANRRITEFEAAPNGMMQLSNELAEMKRKCVELTVWYGAMPESNGKTNWTAILHRKGEGRLDGMTIDRSEYPGRVLYAADRVRYLIGEKAERPHILDYDADKHSGYTARKEAL